MRKHVPIPVNAGISSLSFQTLLVVFLSAHLVLPYNTKENSFSFIPWIRGYVCILLSKVMHTVTSSLIMDTLNISLHKKGTVNMIFYIKAPLPGSASEITWYCRSSDPYWLKLFQDCKQTLEEHLLLSMELTKCSHKYLSFMVGKKIYITTGHIILGCICFVFLKEMHDKYRCSCAHVSWLWTGLFPKVKTSLLTWAC